MRATFIIDPEGVLRAMVYYPMTNGRSVDEFYRLVQALQTSDTNKVACPASWPQNELIGDHVIVPPAKDVKTAKERTGLDNSFDWWFVHKKL